MIETHRYPKHKKVICFACACGRVNKIPFVSPSTAEISILPMIDRAVEKPHCLSFICDECGFKMSFYIETGRPDKFDTDMAGMKLEKMNWRNQ